MKADSFWYQVTANSSRHSSKQFLGMNSLILIINIIGIIYHDHHLTDEDTETYRSAQDIKLVCILLIFITSTSGARIHAFAVTLHCLESREGQKHLKRRCGHKVSGYSSLFCKKGDKKCYGEQMKI